jgi:hypothetical protein
MWKSYLLGCVVLGGLALVSVTQGVPSDEKQAPANVRAEDLCNGNCVILGRLGKPYGQISRIRAVWEYGERALEKPEGRHLRVTHLDGKKLADDRQIIFRGGFFKRLEGHRGTKEFTVDGQVFEGRVYESGGFPDTLPPEVEKILNPEMQPYQPAPWTGFAFHSFLYLID